MQQNKLGYATTANGRVLINAEMPFGTVMRDPLPSIDSHQRSVPVNDGLLMSTEWNVMI
jgi:hypothetical protein